MREQLERIVSSRHFARSQRLRRFLIFTVEHLLAGTADQLKEYLIGKVVFDRRCDYDPRVDPIVRVEARRLRSRLEAYYAAEGAGDRFQIVVPTGTYVPEIREQRVQATPAQPATTCIGLAVLPFANLNAGPEEDYFSDGLAEEILRLLASVNRLRVVGWHSATQLRGRDQNYQEIHDQLKVDYVLRGSVRRAGDRVRVTAHLVDAQRGSTEWSDVFDRHLDDVFGLQEKIGEAIVDSLKLKLELRGRSPAPPKGFSESQRLCLLGRFEFAKRTPEGLRSAVQHFDRAVALEPGNALAHALSAAACALLCEFAILRPSEFVHKARASALQALSLDADSAEAYNALALITIFDWNWPEAESLFRRAIDLNPNFAEARHWFGSDLLALHGRFDEAFEQVRLAFELDPLSVAIRESQGYVSMLARDFEAALSFHSETVQLMPDSYRGHASVGRALGFLGRYDEAIESLRLARRIAPSVPAILGGMGQVLAQAGQKAQARECLAELKKMADTSFVQSTAFAFIHSALGEIDEALGYLEQGCRQREFSVIAMKVHPAFDQLRGEPRAQRLMTRMGMR